MTNSVINFSPIGMSLGDDDFIVDNYMKVNERVLYDLIDTYEDKMTPYRVDDNILFDRISFELYGTVDYWDILIVVNKLSDPLSLPISYELVEAKSVFISDKKIKDLNITDPAVQDQIKQETLDRVYNENELNRVINILDKTDIQNFIRDMKQLNYEG